MFPILIVRFNVTEHVSEEFTYDGLLKADIVLTQAPVFIDNWFGKIIYTLLLVPN